MSTALKSAKKRHQKVRLGRQAGEVCPTTGKRKFTTSVLAQRELTNCQRLRARQGNTTHVEQRAYLCVQCFQYHLTSH